MKRNAVVPSKEVQSLWDKIRAILFMTQNDIFPQSGNGMLDEDLAVRVLLRSGISV